MIAIASKDGCALYALLDALEEDGFFSFEAHLKRWRELQARVKRTSYAAERVQLFELIRTMDRADQLDESWIQAHWPSIQAQATSAPNEGVLTMRESPPPKLTDSEFGREAMPQTAIPQDHFVQRQAVG